MHPPRVVVVDDEAGQRDVLSRFLSARGFRVAVASSALESVPLIRSFRADLVLADIAMPGMSGIGLKKALRSAPETAGVRVMFMTGLPVPAELIEAAANGLGAGPIFVKGGDLHELADGIERRLGADGGEESFARRLRRGALEADPESHSVSYEGVRIHLHGRSMFDLLCALMRSPEPMSRDALHRSLWSESDTPNIVYVAAQRLRRALAPFPAVLIESVPAGYQLTVKAPCLASSPSSPRQ